MQVKLLQQWNRIIVKFILKYFFSCIESFYKTDWKMLKNFKRLIFDYEVIAQETFTATWQNFPLKSKLCLMYPFAIESKMSSDCNWNRTQSHLVCKWTIIDSGFKSSCSHLNFRFCTCFEQGVPWHSGNNRVWIYS